MLQKILKNKKKILFAFSIILLMAVVSFFSFGYGYQEGQQNPQQLIVKGVSNIDQNKNPDIDFNLFWKSWKTLKEKYVDADKLTNQDLVYGAIQGMFSATKDPYTVFMPPQTTKTFNEEISGEFGGIGAEIGVRNEVLTVIAPLKGTPSEKAGLRAGDKIIKINNTSTEGLTAEEAVGKIRGKKGTKIILNIFRDNWSQAKDFEITRDTIQVPTLDWKMLNNNGKEDSNGKILYIQLYNFYQQSPMLLYQALLKSSFNNPKGIILDLRNNPGGYLEAATNISGWFVDKNSAVVIEKFKDNKENKITTNGSGAFKSVPIVVLINQGSASASEILAGALRDIRNVPLVGKKSFGKGSVQELTTLDNSQAKITIAHWLTPKGSMIDKNGLTPDFDINLTEDDIKNGIDPQLKKSVEILNAKI